MDSSNQHLPETDQQQFSLPPKPAPAGTLTLAAAIAAGDQFAVVAATTKSETRTESQFRASGLGEILSRKTNSRRGGVSPIVRRYNCEEMTRRAALVFRVLGMVFSVISFAVMASDKTQGWSGDSFYRYKEYRYCLSITVLTFVYSGFQIFQQSYRLFAGKFIMPRSVSYYFDFFMDQVLAYLLISASSSAASLTSDMYSDWGKDPFTDLAGSSVAMSFLAFVALAGSSLISGYHVYNQNSLL